MARSRRSHSNGRSGQGSVRQKPAVVQILGHEKAHELGGRLGCKLGHIGCVKVRDVIHIDIEAGRARYADGIAISAKGGSTDALFADIRRIIQANSLPASG